MTSLTEQIEGVQIKVFGVAKTIADCFRHRRTVGQSVALEGLQEALRKRKATPAEIARHAERGGVATVIRPYLEALTANGERDEKHRRFGARPASEHRARSRADLQLRSEPLCD